MTKVLIACPGLGHINRGFESFAQECYDALSADERLDVHLFKGAGASSDKERALWNLRRGSKAAETIGKALNRNGYFVEQMTFAASLLPHISRLRPDVVFFSDSSIKSFLWFSRKLTRQRYRLLLSNGGPICPPFARCEYVHQVLPSAAEEAIAAGHPAERQRFIPYGFKIPAQHTTITSGMRADLRGRLGLPTDRRILLSVGALNSFHKRMDYVIREVASLPPPRPYLLLLGNIEEESPALLRSGKELLGEDGFRASTVPQSAVAEYYRAADAFVLASLAEGFGRVFIEAMSHGLPCLAHDYPVTRFVLGEHGLFGDFRSEGALAALLRGPLAEEIDGMNSPERHRAAYERFSWDSLRGDYVDLIETCAAAKLS